MESVTDALFYIFTSSVFFIVQTQLNGIYLFSSITKQNVINSDVVYASVLQ